MRATTATLVAAAAALFCAATSQAATYIPSGTLSGSQEWTTAGSPYVIETTATVGEGTTLTIDPGVVVKFEEANYGELFVIGSLVADGTSTNKVTFTSYADDSAGGDTNGDGSSSGLSCFMKVAGFRARLAWVSGESRRLRGGRRAGVGRPGFGAVGPC